VQISIKEKATGFSVTGSGTYVRRMNADIETQGGTNSIQPQK
jgi:hypothetical protein